MITIIDFTGKAEFYNDGLISGFQEENSTSLINFISPKNKPILNLINTSRFRSIFVPFYVLVTYFIIIIKNKNRVIHFQWLPFESIKLDYLFLLILKFFNKKLILTVHNLLPHDSGNSYLKYNKKVYQLIDELIVHDKGAENQLIAKFKIHSNKITISKIGIEIFNNSKLNWNNKSNKILIFGHIRPYKGVSEFINLIWKNIYKNYSYELIIAGSFEKLEKSKILSILRESNISNVSIIDKRLSDEELDRLLLESKFCVFPYKIITGSAAILSALSYGVTCISSNLPLFKEYNATYGFPYIYKNVEEFNSILLNYKESNYLEDSSNSKHILNNHFNWKKISQLHLNIYLNA